MNTDYIIIALLALLVIENSRFGVTAMNKLIALYKGIKHFFGRMLVK